MKYHGSRRDRRNGAAAAVLAGAVTLFISSSVFAVRTEAVAGGRADAFQNEIAEEAPFSYPVNCPDITVAADGGPLEAEKFEPSEKREIKSVTRDGTEYYLLADALEISFGETAKEGDADGACFFVGEVAVGVDPSCFYAFSNGRYFAAEGNAVLCDGDFYVTAELLKTLIGVTVTEEGALDTADAAFPKDGSEYYDGDSVTWLSRIISAESRGESVMGKVAVGNVVLNRVRTPGYPNTIYGVIFDFEHGIQFTPAANGTVYNDPDGESVVAAKLCLEGVTVSEEILYFLNPSTADNHWVVNNRTYVTTIGSHEFYS